MPGVSRGVSWYELLGVEPDAGAEEIKGAWRTATDKFEPGSGTGQFRLFNEAADVLLDPDKRAAYDAELAGTVAQEPEPTVVEDPAPTVVEERGTSVSKPPETDATDAPDAPVGPVTEVRGRPVPGWVMAVLAVLSIVALVVGGIFYFQNRTETQTTDAGNDASAAAERALPVVLSYDYKTLKADRDQAVRFLSPKYRSEYTATFDKLIESDGTNPGPAVQTQAVVKATVENIGVVSAEAGRVRVIAFLNQTTTKAAGTPTLSLNRLTVSMVKSGNKWLVDNITSY